MGHTIKTTYLISRDVCEKEKQSWCHEGDLICLNRINEYKSEKCNHHESWLELAEVCWQELMISHGMIQSIITHDAVQSKASDGFKRKTVHKKTPKDDNIEAK